MGSKKQIIAIVLLSVLLGGGAVGYSWHMGQTRASTFPGAGYVHIADPEQEVKQLAFQGGAVWHRSLSDTVSFTDTQGVQQKISAMSFAHFDDRSLTALSRGVVVDLNDLDTARMTNHYALAPTVTFANTGSGYTLQNSAVELTLNDFLWKISEDKYMLVSQDISLHFSEEDARDAADYVEITYVDEGVIQLQTAENVWQTVSDICYATLDNGNVVDLALRNVRDSQGEVLMDFSKMVVDSESNIEATPLTEELRNVKESVIPHFDITAVNGKDGESGVTGEPGAPGDPGQAGEAGENGEAGEAGQQGAPGEAGKNGAAGSSGSNGAAGAPGAAGIAGNPGESPQDTLDSEVLSFPEFTIVNWTPTSTGCSGTIMVTDKKNMLQPSNETAASEVYVVDALTGERFLIDYEGKTFPFETALTDGYKFELAGLEPDREYRLVVNAPIDTGVGDRGTYVRNFITKTFYTDSVGIYMEALPSGTDTVSLKVNKQDYAGEIENVTVYLYTSAGLASSVTADNIDASEYACAEVISQLTGDGETITFDMNFSSNQALSPNTRYYARALVKLKNGNNASIKMTPAQVLTLTTLKRTPDLPGRPILTPNRNSWGFDVTPGTVSDPDNGITGYRYEFRVAKAEGSGEGDPDTIVKTVEASATEDLTVLLSGGLEKNKEYQVRMVALFHDNEKTVEIKSEWSNSAKVTGGKLPSVTFENYSEGGSGTENPDADGVSKWYDQIYGTVHVIPGETGSKLMLDQNHHPTVTVRASGYYYVQYKVYLKGGPDVPLDPSERYLLGEVKSDGQVDIEIPQKALEALRTGADDEESSADVSGLKPGTAYRLIVSGDLTDDPNAADSDPENKNITIGVCVVNTPEIKAVDTALSYLKDDSAGDGDSGRTNLRGSVLRLFATPANEEKSSVVTRQRETLSTVTLEALASLDSVNALATVELTQANYKDILRERGYTEDEIKGTSLGEALEKGLPIKARLFGETYATSIAENASAAYIRVSGAADYTAFAENRGNQSKYGAGDREGVNEPGDPEEAVTAYVYTNQYTLNNQEQAPTDNANYMNADAMTASGPSLTYEIPLSPAPDPIPAPERGFLTIVPEDADKDDVIEQYTMTPNYLNGGKLAQYITYYVFDRPDYYDVEYGNSWQLDRDSYLEAYVKDESSGTPTNDLIEVYKTRLPGTPVSSVDSSGKWTWLAKIRVPVPAVGEYTNQMPKVKFIAKTAEAYFKEEYGETEYQAHLQAYRDMVNNADRTGQTPANNTWLLFYPSDGDVKPTGHQFVFAWTLEWAKTSNGVVETKYYPFAMGDYDTITGKAVDKIPHSPVFDMPRKLPVVYGKPWASDLTGKTVTWRVMVNDTDNALVTTSSVGQDQVEFRRMMNAFTALDFKSGTANPEAPVHRHMEDLKTLASNKTLEEDEVMFTLDTDTGPNNKSYDAGLLMQLYNYKYLESYLNNKQPTSDPGRNTISDEKDAENLYTQETIDASEIRENNNIPRYFRALTFNFDPESFPSKEDLEKVKDLTLDIRKGNDSSGSYAEYDFTLKGDWELLKKANGVRLTFTSTRNGKTETVILDKYFEYTLDRINGNENFVTGEAQEVRFRVHIDRELSRLQELFKDVGTGKASVSAALLYEDSREGYSYADSSRPFSVVNYTDPAQKTADNRKWWKFIVRGASPSLELSDVAAALPRFGTFLTLPKVEGWPETITPGATRAELWEDQGWNKETYQKNTRFTDLEWTAVQNVPRTLGTAELESKNIVMDGNPVTEIEVPPGVPIIHYGESSNASNQIGTKYNIIGTLPKNEIFFTLELVEGGVSKLLQGKQDDLGIWQWTPYKDASGKTVPSNVDTINALTGASGTILFPEYNVTQQGGEYSHSFKNLTESSNYRIRAYYKTAEGYKLLNEVDVGTGEYKQGGNFCNINTTGKPEVSLEAIYHSLAYTRKYLSTQAKVSNLSDYYYTLELVDPEGNAYYIDTGSNRGGNSDAPKEFDLDYNNQDGDLTIYRDAKLVADQTGINSYPRIEGSQRLYLKYGQTYSVRMRVYNIGAGPAYTGGSDADDLLNGSGPVRTFTVTEGDDALNISGHFDLKDGKSPTANFTMVPSVASARLWNNQVALVVVRARTENGVTTYTDVTADLANSADDKEFAEKTFYFSRNTLSLDLSDSAKYHKDDQFYCFAYGIMDDKENTTTEGKPKANGGTKSRDWILGSLPRGGELTAEQFGILMNSSWSEEVVENGTIIGKRQRLFYNRVAHLGTTASLGEVSVMWADNDYRNVQLSLVNSVDLDTIKTLHWTITAQCVLKDGTTKILTEDKPNDDLQALLSGSKTSITLRPSFAIPENVVSMDYTITLICYDGGGKSVPMSIQGTNGTVVTQDGTTKLSATLSYSKAGAASLSLRRGAGNNNLFALLSGKKRGRIA